MKPMIATILSFVLMASSVAPAAAQGVAQAFNSSVLQPKDIPSLLQVWNVSAERFAAMTDEQQVKLIKGMGFLEAGRRMRIEELKVAAKENWMNYLTPQGHITPEGEALIDAAFARAVAEIEPLDWSLLGLDPETVSEIGGSASSGADAEELARKTSSLFDGSGPSAPMLLGETATGAAGAAGSGHLFAALAAKHQALAFAGHAQAAKAAAQALARQAILAAKSGDLARAGQLAVQAKASGAEAMNLKEAALHAADKAHGLANLAKILTVASGGIAIADGLWDVYKGIEARGDTQDQREVDESFLAAVQAVSDGVMTDVGSRIARAYFSMLGIEPSSVQRDIIVQSFNDVAFAVPAEIAAKAAEVVRRALAELEAQGRRADERIVIGGVKVSAGALIVISALLLNPVTGPWVAAGASVVYLAATAYQHRDKLLEAWEAVKLFFSSSTEIVPLGGEQP
ncbi:MAG: hypothetical protein AAB036_01815 [Elusimicrobiota bacterium]